MRDIEDAGSPRATPRRSNGERDVRMLMSLTRALRDLAALRKQSAADRGSAITTDDDGGETIPASIDALRQELSRRLYGMAAGRARHPTIVDGG